MKLMWVDGYMRVWTSKVCYFGDQGNKWLQRLQQDEYTVTNRNMLSEGGVGQILMIQHDVLTVL